MRAKRIITSRVEPGRAALSRVEPVRALLLASSMGTSCTRSSCKASPATSVEVRWRKGVVKTAADGFAVGVGLRRWRFSMLPSACRATEAVGPARFCGEAMRSWPSMVG